MEGDIYQEKNPYKFKTMMDFNPRCTVCDQNFEPEPNFYYGAMYVSYGYTVALFLAVYVVFSMFLDWEMWPTIGALALILILAAPLIFRTARSTWLSLFVPYDKNIRKKP